MKLATFNIRCDHGQDGNHNFRFRQPLILEKLRREAPDSPELAALRESPYRNITEGTGVTYHGFGRADRSCSIDYILTRGFACRGAAKWTGERDGVYLSDHCPVCALLVPGAEEG